MATKASNVEFDSVITTVKFDTEKNLVSCVKTFYKSANVIHSDLMEFDLRVMPLQVALQMASGYVQMCALSHYE